MNQSNRLEIAQQLYENFKFDPVVVASDGWEYTSPGVSLSRIVYVEPFERNEEIEEENTERVVFYVNFKDEHSDEISDAYALDLRSGEIIGDVLFFA